MNKKITKTLVAIVCLLCSIHATAHDFEINGIYYNITSDVENTVAVTHYGEVSIAAPDEYKYTGVVTIPESVTYNETTYNVTTIDSIAFKQCTELTQITIPNSITSIGNNAFNGCSGLSEVTIPASITSLGDYSFANINNLNAINFYADNCSCIVGPFSMSGTKNLNIGNSVTTIPDVLFAEIKSLETVYIPASVKSISSTAFMGSMSEYIVVDEGNTVYDSRENCNAIIEKSTKKLIYGSGNTTIPEGVTTIDNNAFTYNLNLLSITIPSSVVSIGEQSFLWCDNLTEITCLAKTPPTIGFMTFFIANPSIPVYVPAESLDDYKNQWGLFLYNILSIESKRVKLTLQNSYYNNVIFFLTPGTEQQIQIIDTDSRFVLNAVTFNGENVTDQLVDGFYTTPAIEKDAVLNISYQIPTAQNAPINNSHIKAYGYRGDVIVTGCEKGDNIAIYNVDGVLLRTIFATSNTMRITMPTDEIYVVRIADVAIKVAL